MPTLVRRHLNPLHNPFPTPSSSDDHSSSYISVQDSRLLHWRTGLDDRDFRIHGQTLLYILILFTVILLATLLLLYARWFFRLRHLPPPPLPTAHRVTRHHLPPPRRVVGLDKTTIELIPIALFREEVAARKDGDDQEEVVECCICLGLFEDGDKVKILPRCCHRYHCECVDVWLCSNSNCPLCRLPVVVLVDPDPLV